MRFSVHTGLFDVANAFPSPGHNALDSSVLTDTCHANDVPLLKTRHRTAIVQVTRAEGHTVLLAVGSGALQGDTVAPEQFAALYSPVVLGWLRDTERADQLSLLTAVCPFSGFERVCKRHCPHMCCLRPG